MLSPRENLTLFGHQDAKKTLLKAFHSQRFPPAWILAGPVGIGKATLAFHIARYILSGRQDENAAFAENDSLHRRIVAQSHGDLWALGGEENQEIGVELIRGLNGFLNQTPAEGGWRVVILDGAEKLNRHAANALLKRLEEPPPKTAFFLTTALPGRLLATLRSRCQLLHLKLLSEEDVQRVLQSQDFSLLDYLPASQGNPGQCMRLMEGEGVSLYAHFQKVLKGEPAHSFIHTYGADEASYTLIEDLLRSSLHTFLLEKVEGKSSFFKDVTLDQALKVHEKVEDLFDSCRMAQLERKATLACVFAHLENRNPS